MITEDNYCILIPARRDSKGVPFKNRKLFSMVLSQISKDLCGRVFVSTNDSIIREMSDSAGFNVHERTEESALDSATTKDMVKDFLKSNLSYEYVIMLYLTYPHRQPQDIREALDFFRKNNAKSMLCREEVSHSPYLMMFEEEDGRGSQIIRHNLCRRQDYRDCFRLSHYISIFKAIEVDNLNNNMYNEDTIFYKTSNSLDIDDVRDMDRLI